MFTEGKCGRRLENTNKKKHGISPLTEKTSQKMFYFGYCLNMGDAVLVGGLMRSHLIPRTPFDFHKPEIRIKDTHLRGFHFHRNRMRIDDQGPMIYCIQADSFEKETK